MLKSHETATRTTQIDQRHGRIWWIAVVLTLTLTATLVWLVTAWVVGVPRDLTVLHQVYFLGLSYVAVLFCVHVLYARYPLDRLERHLADRLGSVAWERHRIEVAENPHPVMRISHNGTILYANRASQSLLSEFRPEIIQAALKSWQGPTENTEGAKNGNEIAVQLGERTCTFLAVPRSGTGYANVYGRDITDLRRREEQVELANVELASRARELLGTLLDLRGLYEESGELHSGGLADRNRKEENVRVPMWREADENHGHDLN